MTNSVPIDDELALGYLSRFLSVEGVTGCEKGIGDAIVETLSELRVPPASMVFDEVHKRIPVPTESGNLIVDISGTEPHLPARLFVAHRDTVALAAGAEPTREGERINPAGATALGGDDRCGVACLVNLVACLTSSGLRHGPLRLLFTVREESGLWGARSLRPGRLGECGFAFNLDGPSPSRFVIGAPGIANWKASIKGQAAHAGLHPEKGISAPMVAALALSEIAREGWFGDVRRREGVGKANVGTLCGSDGGCVGGATNVIADYVRVEGEVRSHTERFVDEILAAHLEAFQRAVRRMPNDSGEIAGLEFQTQTLCHPFRLDPGSDLVHFAVARAENSGIQPNLKVVDGGLDANWLVRHGIPTLTFGVGQRDIHSLNEHVHVPDYLAACRLAVALAVA